MRPGSTAMALMLAACNAQPTGSIPAYAPADAFDRLKEGMTTKQANRALGVEGTEIAASGAMRTLSWGRQGRSQVTANFMHDRLTAKRE